MDAPPSLEVVLQALKALYLGDDVAGKEKASVWLGELQKSVYAWQISDQLLQLNQDMESCYFAAQTMRSKIQYSFEELPQSSHQVILHLCRHHFDGVMYANSFNPNYSLKRKTHSSLRDSLINHCTKINQETPQVIVTQLCLALADLALQMSSWKNAAQELIQQFGANTQYWTFLMELFSVLPEEIGSRPLRLGDNRRDEITDELRQASPLLLQLLVVRCLGSWLNVQAVPVDLVITSSLMQLPFAALTNKECPSHLHHAATECVCSTLVAIENLDKYSLLAKAMFEGILTLAETYHLSVASEDLDKAMNYCRIFTDMAVTFLTQMVATPNQGFGDFRTLDLLLMCVGHHHYEVADITFTFWNGLSDTLYDEPNTEINQVFIPYLHRLIIALARHCQFDETMEGIPEEEGDFDDFRKRAADIVSDYLFLVNANDVFYQMFQTLKGAEGKGAPWNVCEAALYIMSAVAKRVNADSSDDVVAEVLMVILSQPEGGHMSVRHSSMLLIGELREWISLHPHVLESVLQFLLVGLREPKLATVSADALQAICSRCCHQMAPHFSGLLDIVRSVDSFNVCNDAIMGLVKGSAYILSKLSHDQIAEGMRQLCAIQALPLNNLLEKDVIISKISAGNKEEDPAVWLDRLAIIFRSTSPQVDSGQIHPCQEVIAQLWPLLSRTFSKYSIDVRIIERCCRCVRFAVRCLGRSSTVLLEPLVNQMVELYQQYPHSCCLYLGSILVDEYGTQPQAVNMLIAMLQVFCTQALKSLDEPRGLRNHPDTVDDLFRLCYRFVQRCPVEFLQCEMIRAILQCGVACCSLDHREANSSVTTFFHQLITSARERRDQSNKNGGDMNGAGDGGDEVRKEQVRVLTVALLGEHGQALVGGVLKAILFSVPTYLHSDLAELIYELMKVDRPAVCIWLEAELKQLPNQSPGGGVTATSKQLADFHKTITSAEDMKTVGRAFREFARLYR